MSAKKIIIALLILVGIAAEVVVVVNLSHKDPYPALEAGNRPAWAIERLREIAIKNPDDLKAKDWLLRLALEKEDLTEAESRLNMLRIKAPDDIITISGQCRLYIRQEKWAAAEDNCEKMLAGSERSIENLLAAASVHLKTGKLDKAGPLLDEALQKAPDDARIINNLGYHHLLKKEYGQAIPLFVKALREDGQMITARKNLARAYYETLRYKEAVEEMEKVVQDNPGDVAAMENIVVICIMRTHDWDLAQKYLDLAGAKGMNKNRRDFLEAYMNEAKQGEAKKQSSSDLPGAKTSPRK